MSTMKNHNYRIGTDVLADGRVKATAHGRKRNVQTFPAGTAPSAAAEQLARKIEGARFAEVRNYMTVGTKADWDIYVTIGGGLTPAEYNGLDAYTKSVWDETYRERLNHYRKVTPYAYANCADMAARDADRAARTYNETGERIDFTAAAL